MILLDHNSQTWPIGVQKMFQGLSGTAFQTDTNISAGKGLLIQVELVCGLLEGEVTCVRLLRLREKVKLEFHATDTKQAVGECFCVLYEKRYKYIFCNRPSFHITSEAHRLK